MSRPSGGHYAWSREERPRHRPARTVFRLFLWAVLGFVLVYWVGANAALSTSAIRDLVATSGVVDIQYGSAWTVLPGRVHLTDLRLRVADSNVELTVDADRVDAKLDLPAFLKQTVHLDEAKVKNVRFRFRPRLDSIAGRENIVAAYPPIRGMPDPPMRPRIVEPVDISKLWTIHLENIEASVAELWIVELRYEGHGHLAGGMFLEPLRQLAVDPSEVNLNGGRVQVAGTDFAEPITLEARGEVAEMSLEGDADVVPQFRGGIDVDAELIGVDYLGAYFPNLRGAFAGGAGSLHVDGGIDEGALQPGTRFEFETSHLVGRTKRYELEGGLHLKGVVAGDAPEGRTILTVRSHRLHLERHSRSRDDPRGPRATELRARIRFEGRRPFGGLHLHDAELDMTEILLEDARWLNGPLGSRALEFTAGRASSAAQVTIDAERRVVGNFSARFRALTLKFPALAAAMNGHLGGHLDYSLPKERGRLEDLTLDLDYASISDGEVKTSYSGALTSPRIDIEGLPPRKLEGSGVMMGGDVRRLFPLVLDTALEERLAGAIVGDGRTRIPLTFNHQQASSSMVVKDARSGRLGLEATIGLLPGGAWGAILVEGRIFNVGVRLENGESFGKLFASTSWYDEQAQRVLERARAAERTAQPERNEE